MFSVILMAVITLVLLAATLYLPYWANHKSPSDSDSDVFFSLLAWVAYFAAIVATIVQVVQLINDVRTGTSNVKAQLLTSSLAYLTIFTYLGFFSLDKVAARKAKYKD